jgi:Transposase DDE domain
MPKEIIMAQSTTAKQRDTFQSVRDRLRGQDGLPFLALLSRDTVAQTCHNNNHRWRERIYTPWITLGVFLSQILSDDQSCDDAVSRLQKYRYDRGLPAVGTDTTSYCEARQRLPERLFWDLALRVGRAIHRSAKTCWLCRGRPVKIVDGSTVLAPDTPANQAAYPQPRTQKAGLGFPVVRILVVLSLAVGTVLEAALGPYQGKQTSELALLRLVINQFQPGDIVLGDRFFCSYWVIAELRHRGVDVVFRLHQRRTADFRRGRRLGPADHLVTWTKPDRPDWMSPAVYETMPAELPIREVRVRVQDKTKRARKLVVVTTLTDAAVYPARVLGGLFRQRWHAELDLRTLKTNMRMEMLRTKTPEMVRKEFAVHLLGYNLIRGVMAEAAQAAMVCPRQLSFKGALHEVRAFEQAHLYDPVRIAADLPRLLQLIGGKRVGNRPDRYEPRAVKRRPKPHPLLRMTRKAAKRLIERGRHPYNKA